MPSIFDVLLGRNTGPTPALPGTPPFAPPSPISTASPSILDAYSDKGAAARDTLMGLSQGLLSAGGPSQVPMDMFSALGKGISGGLTARDAGEDKTLKRALIGAQVQKANADIANEKAWQDMFKSPAAAPVAKPPDPSNPAVVAGMPGAGPSSPTNPGNLSNGQGGFQSFKTPEEGVAAAIRNVQSYPAKYNNGQPMSLLQVAQAWAPPDDGKTPQLKGNDPVAWAKNVATVMGVDPTAPVDFNNPATGLAFAKAVHVAEHPPGSAYAPDVYQRGAGMAYGAAPAPGGATAPPVQLAQASGAVPVPSAPPAAPVKTLPEVIQSLPPAVRQMMGAMPRKDALPLLMKYADPETHVAIDTTTGAVVFAPKHDNSGRYQPVDAMKLDLEKQRVESERRQAAARERANDIRGANEPMQPPTVPGGAPTPTPGYVEQKGAVTGAEAAAKVAPALVEHQGQLVIKDIQQAQTGAEHARVGTANLSRLGSLLDQVNTNKFAGTTLELKAAAKAAGINMDALGIGDNVGVAQAAKALSQQMALQLRDPSGGGGMPGSMSDADRQFLTTMVPAITNDPNANKLMLDWQKKIYQRQIEVAKIVNDYGRSPEFLKDPTGVYAKVREYADKNPLFDPEKDAPKGASSAGGSLPMPPMSAIDAEIERRKSKQGVR